MIWCYACNEEILLKSDTSTPESKKTATLAGEVLTSVVDTLNPPPVESSDYDSNKSDMSEAGEENRAKRDHQAAWMEIDRLLRSSAEELQEILPTPKYKPGLCGLRNIGNTCYMNSALQALNSTPPLRQLMLGPHQLRYPMTSSRELRMLLNEYEDLYDYVWSGTATSAVPKGLHTLIGRINPLFRGYAQHDSQELLRTLLDSLHESTKRPDYSRYKAPTTSPTTSNKSNGKTPKPIVPEESSIEAIFEGKLLSTVTCGNCLRKSNTMDRFFDLSLSIPTSSQLSAIARRREKLAIQREFIARGSNLADFASESIAPTSSSGGSGWWGMFNISSWFGGGPNVDLETCLHGFCLEDELTGQDRYRCEHCKVLHDATKAFSIAQLPQILCLHIKRFKYDIFGSKVSDYVRFPLVDFDMSDFCAPADALSSDESSSNNSSTSNGHGSSSPKANGTHSTSSGTSSRRPKKTAAAAPQTNGHQKSQKNGSTANGGAQNDTTAKLSRPLYDLYAVICHSGGLHGGHYYAYAKHPGANVWFEFNDSYVAQVDEETVANAEAYVLFYEQKTPSTKIDERERVKSEIRHFIQAFKNSSPPSGTPYISMTWFMKWLMTNEPGPINAPALTCEHNHPLKLRTPFEFLIPLPEKIAKQLQSKYGGTLWHERTAPCTVCEARRMEEEKVKLDAANRQEEIKARRAEEYQNVETLGRLLKDTKETQRGYYFVEKNWITSWLNFVKGTSEEVPGPIDNKPIVSRHRVNNKRYRVLNASVWEYLFSKYGGGPVLTAKQTRMPQGLGLPPGSVYNDPSDDDDSDDSFDSDSSE